MSNRIYPQPNKTLNQAENYRLVPRSLGGVGRIFGFLLFFALFAISYSLPAVSEASTIKAPPSNLGLVAYYPMNEGGGVSVGDHSGGNHQGTASGGLTWGQGKISNATVFDGTDGLVTIDAGLTIPVTGSISFWWRPDEEINSGTINHSLFQVTRSSPELQIFEMFRYSDGSMYSGWYTASGGDTRHRWVVTGITINQWHNVVLRWTDNGAITLYIDNVLINDLNPSNQVTWDTSAETLKFGFNSTETAYADMALDDFRIYNRVLSTAEMTALYNYKKITTVGVTQSTGSLSTGLVGHWSFDGKDTNWTSATTGTVTDASGNGNTGTLTSMAQATSPVRGVIGQAMSFDGVGDYVDTADINSVDGVTAVTVSAWIKENSLVADKAIVAKWDYSTQGNFAFQTGSASAGKLSVYLATSLGDTGTGSRTDTTSSVLTADKWQHVLFVYDGSLTGNTNRLKIYVDGSSVALTQGAGTVPASLVAGSTATVKLGLFGGGLTRYFNGSLDDVRIYSRALSTAEITRLYNMGRPTTLSTLYSPPLDNTQSAVLAYSIRKLRTAYTGSAIQVRRSAGGTQDIGFVGNNLDTATLESFCASDDCFVSVWYDQSGNGADLTQATEAQHPKIVSSGTILTGANSKPTITFDGADDGLFNNAVGSYAHPRMTSAVMSNTVSEYGSYPWTNSVSGGSYSWNGGLAGFGNNNFKMSRIAGASCCNVVMSPGVNYVYQGYYNDTGSVARLNNNANVAASLGSDTITGHIIGGFYDGGSTGHFAEFKMQEFIMWNRSFDQLARNRIRDNQNQYFQVY